MGGNKNSWDINLVPSILCRITRGVIVRALYGLRSSGAAWRSFISNKLEDLGFTSSEADPDVWLRPAVKQMERSITSTSWSMWMTL